MTFLGNNFFWKIFLHLYCIFSFNCAGRLLIIVTYRQISSSDNQNFENLRRGTDRTVKVIFSSTNVFYFWLMYSLRLYFVFWNLYFYIFFEGGKKYVFSKSWSNLKILNPKKLSQRICRRIRGMLKGVIRLKNSTNENWNKLPIVKLHMKRLQ